MTLYPWYLLSLFSHFRPHRSSFCSDTWAPQLAIFPSATRPYWTPCPQVFPPSINPLPCGKNDMSNVCDRSDHVAAQNSPMAPAPAPAPCFSPCLPHSHPFSSPSSGHSLGPEDAHNLSLCLAHSLDPHPEPWDSLCTQFRTRASICVLAQTPEVLGRAVCPLIHSPLLLPPLNFT